MKTLLRNLAMFTVIMIFVYGIFTIVDASINCAKWNEVDRGFFGLFGLIFLIVVACKTDWKNRK